MSDCVLCDWTFGMAQEAVVAQLPLQAMLPLAWSDAGPVTLDESAVMNVGNLRRVAVVAHWAQEHPLQLTLALGRDDWYLRPL